MNEINNFFNSEELCGYIGKPIRNNQTYEVLKNLNLVEQKGNRWRFTKKGIESGGFYNKESEQILWKIEIKNNPVIEKMHLKKMENVLNTTEIAKLYYCTSEAVNNIFLNWDLIHKAENGFRLTEKGKNNGGEESFRDIDKYNPFYWTSWPIYIYENNDFKNEISFFTFKEQKENYVHQTKSNFIKTNVPEIKTDDGHLVRSKSEKIIDDFLYKHSIIHAYEKSLPQNETVFADFYLPESDVYIEHWGLENDNYSERKNKKIEIYKKYKLKLIELNETNIKNFSDIFPNLLTRHGYKLK